MTDSGARLDDWFPTTKYIMVIRYTKDIPGSQQLRGQDGKPVQEQRVESYIEKQGVATNKCKCREEGNGML